FFSSCCWPTSAWTVVKTPSDSTKDAARATTQGQWLRSRRNFGPRKAMTPAANSGSSGISHSTPGAERRSNMARLLAGLAGLAPGGRQVRQRLLARRGRQRLLVQRRLLVRLAQLLPDADVQRALAPVQHQDQGQGDRRLAR